MFNRMPKRVRPRSTAQLLSRNTILIKNNNKLKGLINNLTKNNSDEELQELIKYLAQHRRYIIFHKFFNKIRELKRSARAQPVGNLLESVVNSEGNQLANENLETTGKTPRSREEQELNEAKLSPQAKQLLEKIIIALDLNVKGGIVQRFNTEENKNLIENIYITSIGEPPKLISNSTKIRKILITLLSGKEPNEIAVLHEKFK